MSIDKQIEEIQNSLLAKVTYGVEEFLVISVGLADIFNPWDYILLNLAYLMVMYLGNIFGMIVYTESFICSVILNTKVYLMYIYLQSAKRYYLNHANNENDKP